MLASVVQPRGPILLSAERKILTFENEKDVTQRGDGRGWIIIELITLEDKRGTLDSDRQELRTRESKDLQVVEQGNAACYFLHHAFADAMTVEVQEDDFRCSLQSTRELTQLIARQLSEALLLTTPNKFAVKPAAASQPQVDLRWERFLEGGVELHQALQKRHGRRSDTQ